MPQVLRSGLGQGKQILPAPHLGVDGRVWRGSTQVQLAANAPSILSSSRTARACSDLVMNAMGSESWDRDYLSNLTKSGQILA